MAMAPLLRLALLAISSGASGSPWRLIAHPERPVPSSLDEARALHAHAKAKTRAHMLKHGHKPAGALAACQQDRIWSSADDHAAASGPLIEPTAFGADPTGRADSTDALIAAVAQLTNTTARAVHPMAKNITNLGGATLDLEGGEYLISGPLTIPAHIGNVRIRGGMLRASAAFPSTRFLIEVGEPSCKGDGQGVCNEFILLQGLFLDAAHVAAGGVLISGRIRRSWRCCSCTTPSTARRSRTMSPRASGLTSWNERCVVVRLP